MVGRRAEVGLPHQAFALRSRFPASQVSLTHDRLEWRAVLQPAPTTRDYQVTLKARRGWEPRVFVTAPDLIPDEKGRLPHVYDNGAICLNRRGDWQPSMLYIDTFVPWASQWLYFYEIWKATNVWHGDGEEALDETSQTALLHPFPGPIGVDS